MNRDLKIRSMSPVDLVDVMKIEEISFPVPWSLRTFQTELTHNPLAYYLVALKEESLMAYLGSWIFLTDAHLTTLAVHPTSRRSGLARHLLGYLFREMLSQGVRRISLEVRGSNVKALMLYRSLGFVQVGKRSKYYYDNQEDALILCLELK